MLQPGDIVPDFTLPDAEGKAVSLSSFGAKTKVIYFYPKDDTPGCTTEACEFRDAYQQILDKGAVILGISKDGAASHQKFAQKYSLPFLLLSDKDGEVIRIFGAWGDKSLYGKIVQGIIRATFVLDGQNRVVAAFPKVKPAGHAAEILAVL